MQFTLRGEVVPESYKIRSSMVSLKSQLQLIEFTGGHLDRGIPPVHYVLN